MFNELLLLQTQSSLPTLFSTSALSLSESPTLVSSTGSKLLPDHQEARRPVAGPQEAGPEQHAALLHSRAVCGRRAADAPELRNLQLCE